MKLLFDQNISFRVVKILDNHFSGSAQVRQLQLEGARDRDIWEFAKGHNFVIVTFDADFYDFSNLYGLPPKIIWLRTGNSTTLFIANLLTQKEDQIINFLEDKDVSCLEIY